jgi:hypothetical protein
MKLQNIFMSAAMLAIFVLATLNLVIGLVQCCLKVVQSILAATLFVAKIACKFVKSVRQVLNSLDCLLSVIDEAVNTIYSSLEDWMVSTVPIPIVPPNKSTALLTSAATFSSERTAFEERAIVSIESIFQRKPQSATNSLELPVALTKPLMLVGAAPIPLERTAFEYHAISAIARSLELVIAESESTVKSREAIVPIIPKLLGEVITIGKATELIPLSVPGVYVQRTPKKKRSKNELSKLTIPKLRELIAESSSSVAKPKKSAKKSVLVDWLMVN